MMLSVLDAFEKKPSGRCGCARSGAGFLLKNCSDFLWLDVTASSVKEGADQISDHVVQEAVAADPIAQ